MKPSDRQQYRLAQYILQQIEQRDRTHPEQLRGYIPDIRETFSRLSASASASIRRFFRVMVDVYPIES
jgi:hypothetical protein